MDQGGSESVSISEFTNRVRSKYGNSPSVGTATPEDLAFDLISSKYEMKIVLQQFSYKNPKYSETDSDTSEKGVGQWYGISGIALLKKKAE